ncbi:hypothetical protein DYB38_005121 [Aphanomyces astaci]|uniref:Alanine--tRNA ligase n=1 Tax=Aphanomyces astaci TaxID=112090 RepID=A0A397D607_APHAT|nr:hypothetical protein DYB38_005121 [Aphanomyces astaci]
MRAWSSSNKSGIPIIISTHNRLMVATVQVFLGHETRDYTRATSSQRCVRAGGKHNDLDQVGFTARHHTSFDMLGNFSFGDYFKEEAIFHAWNVLTKEFDLPIDRLHVTVLDNDVEAIEWWRKIAQLPDDKIRRLGPDDNFWAMGDTGPCGPCSEIFFDQGEAFSNYDDRYLELWNLVFMQHNRLGDGSLLPLPTPCVDTGMGLERMASVMQGVISNYHSDVFTPHLHAVAAALDVQNGHVSSRFQDAVADELRLNRFGTDVDIQIVRVLADHLRTAYALMEDGVFPSNVGRGYVLRRILRRAMRFAQQAGVSQPFLSRIPMFGEGERKGVVQLQAVVDNEERAFYAMLAQGTKAVDKLLHHPHTKSYLTGHDAFFLYETYGLSIDMTESIAASFQATVDTAGFDAVRQRHQEAIAATSSPLGLSTSNDDDDDQTHHHVLVPTPFVGYDTTLVHHATVLQASRVKHQSKTSKHPAVVALALSPCPFYAEGGGQVGDRGWVSVTGFDAPWPVVNTVRAGPETIHVHVQVPTTVDDAIAHLTAQPTVTATVDAQVRQRVAAHHSATHVLQAALRETLGAHVTQCGSYVGPDRLRFDFAHFGAVTDEELRAVEVRVNQVALDNVSVHVGEMDKATAQASGAIAAFGEKYGDLVRVVQVGSVSSEFCGGTHVSSTSALVPFVILSEASVAAGTRRIEAVAGLEGIKRLQEKNQLLEDIAGQLNTVPAMVTQKLARLDAQQKALEGFNQSLTDRFVYGPVPRPSKTVEGTWGLSGTVVTLHLHEIADLSLPPTADKPLVNLYMTALRRRAEHVAKLDLAAVHLVVMGDSVICMGNGHVNAGEVFPVWTSNIKLVWG